MAETTCFLPEYGFCSECGSILPNMNLIETCRVCRYKNDQSAFAVDEVVTSIAFPQPEWMKKTKAASEIPEGPLVDRKCSKCGHEGMTYATLQTRSADEGQTVFYTCPQCKFKEIENS